MPSEAFARYALGEALRERLGGRRVLAALFTTYTFDPGFFELHVLPLLFSRGFSKEQTVRMVQLDEELHSTPVTVYFDRGALDARGGGSLGFQSFGIRRATTTGATKGCFHPKLCLALVDAGESEEALVIGVFSANLTEAGHWTNVECAWIDEIAAGALCSYQEDLVGILVAIRDEARIFETRHDALERILKFLRRVDQARQRTQDGWFQARLFYGQGDQSFANFLRDELRLPGDTYHLEIISPFFDDSTALRDLHAALAPKSTRVYLPLRDDNAATVERTYFDTLRELPSATWARFVDPSYLRRGAKNTDELRRGVHAKVYRLWSKAEGASREFVVLGSVNLTAAAHSPRRAGNLEVAVVLESREPLLRPFLVPIDQDPVDFGASSEVDEEKPGADAPCPLLLRFYWASKRLEAFWDSSTRSPQIVLQIGGVRLSVEVEPLEQGSWVALPLPLATALAEHLPRTSLVQVHLPDSEPRWIVVQEEDLAQKPSLLLHLTVEEILRYWSALSDAQRQALLERADLRRVRALEALPQLPGQDGMFDRFAGVFHAFERLREHIEKAVAENRPRDAEYRLFGAKHDSLPSLLDRVVNDDDCELVLAQTLGETTDPTTRLAVRYATFLSVKRLLRQLEDSIGAFLAEHPADVKRLRAMLDADTLRHRVAQGCGTEGETFVAWFDGWFLGKRDRSEE